MRDFVGLYQARLRAIEATPSTQPSASDARRSQGMRAWMSCSWPKSTLSPVPPRFAATTATVPSTKTSEPSSSIRGVRSGLERYNAEHPGSSTRIRRVILLAEPPDIDANEITDKGYVNQQAALERRKASVERLYAEPPETDVITLES